jgi:hypothetical protein
MYDGISKVVPALKLTQLRHAKQDNNRNCQQDHHKGMIKN